METEARLAPLEAKGWIMLHDRWLPGGRENIDHIAIGPPGVFVIETKNWKGPVVVGSGKLTKQGRRYGRAVTHTDPGLGIRDPHRIRPPQSSSQSGDQWGSSY